MLVCCVLETPQTEDKGKESNERKSVQGQKDSAGCYTMEKKKKKKTIFQGCETLKKRKTEKGGMFACSDDENVRFWAVEDGGVRLGITILF